MTEPDLFVPQDGDDGDDVRPEGSQARSAAGTEATKASSSGAMAVSKSEELTDQKAEPKTGGKRNLDSDDDDDVRDQNWGDGVRMPKPEIGSDAKIMGKKAGSYSIPELRRILQHFGRAAAMPLNPKKDDLLQMLVELEAEKKISAKGRLWITRQPLGPGGTLFQNLDTDGNPTPDSFPFKHAPRKRSKTSNMSKPRAQTSKVVKPPSYSRSKAMPPSGPYYAAYSSVSPSMRSGHMSKAEGKQPAKEVSVTTPAEQMGLVLMTLSNQMHTIVQELADVKKTASAAYTVSQANSTAINEGQLNSESRERSGSADSENEDSECPSSPLLGSEASLPDMVDISSSSDTDQDEDSDCE